MMELFRNAAKIKQLFDEGSYLKAAALAAKTLAALLGEFSEGDDGVPVMRAKGKPKAADVKNLEKAEATLASIQAAPAPVGAEPTGAGGAGLAIFLQVLPILLEWLRKRKEQQG